MDYRLPQALPLNLLSYQVIQAAVGREDGYGLFYVGNPREWWGQFLIEGQPIDQDSAAPPATDAASGRSVSQKTVRVVSLNSVVGTHEVVDLVNMDCQVGIVSVIALVVRFLWLK